MISDRWGIEAEGGYIFPFNLKEYPYRPYSHFSKDPRPFLPSTGYVGRAALRYYYYASETAKSLFFAGAGFVYKYRYYGKTYFYDWEHRESSYCKAIEQSQKNNAYAGELNLGIRLQSKKHFLFEVSMGIDAGSQYRTTYIYATYTGSPPNNVLPDSKRNIKEWKPYFTINPCVKLGYAF